MWGQLTRGSPCSLPSLGSLLRRPPRGHPSPWMQHPGNQDASLQLCCAGGGGTNWVSDVSLTAPRDPHLQLSLPLMLSSTFQGPRHPWMGLSHSSGVSSQPHITLDHVERFADSGWASAPRARVPSHQGHFCSGPHLAHQPTQTHTWGLIRGWKWGAVIPPAEEPPGLEARVSFAPEGGACFWLEGRGPLSPSCTKRFYKDTLSSFLVYGDPQPGILCSLQGTPAGQASPDTLFNCPPTCTDPEPPPSTPPPHLST